MRWLINYLRQCFCTHEWEDVKILRKFEDDASVRPYKVIYMYRCKKCGYTKKTVAQ